jgi:hypothetical protein
MEFLLSLPKILLDLAVSLLKIKKDDRSRQRFADLLTAVAKCISGIADAINNNEHPTKLCSELDTYIVNIEAFIEEQTDKKTARKLTLWLRHVGDVPGIAKLDLVRIVESESKPRWSRSQRFQQAESVRNIAGLIEGTANLVRL